MHRIASLVALAVLASACGTPTFYRVPAAARTVPITLQSDRGPIQGSQAVTGRGPAAVATGVPGSAYAGVHMEPAPLVPGD